MNYETGKQIVQQALLDDALSKAIQRNEEQCKVWRAYAKDHQKVAEALQTFQKDLHINCMVPIGKRALMRGKLIHTNEVLAFLGDGYFAKYSTAGAVALCKRRIQRAEEMLKNLSTEKDLYETRMMMIEGDLFEDCPGREIVEHWNDEQIEEWRKKHREREKEYHQKLAKLKQEEKKPIETEEDLFNRLDQLEIEEELADELNRLEDEGYELFGEELEEDECYSETESSLETEEDNAREDKLVSDPEKKELEENVKNTRKKNSVVFAEPQDDINVEDEDILRINFSHSSNDPTVKSDGDSIESPTDIYRVFLKPKSILKRSLNDLPAQAAPLEYSTEEDDEEEECSKPSAYITVVKDIKERDTTVPVTDVSKIEKETRPLSKFRRDRQSK